MTTVAMPIRRTPPADPAEIAVRLGQRFISDTNDILLGAGMLNDEMACATLVRSACVTMIEAAIAWDPAARNKVILLLAEREVQHPGKPMP